tara:strand:- start:584 stop:913 length:330 start_codon:yes stop_codon:yes gene_type:complete
MAWNVGAFGANAWNYGEVTVPVTSTSAIGTTALGNESVVEGTGAVFGVTSTSAIASHTVGSVSVVEGTGVSFGVNSTGAFATGLVGEEVVWFEIPTNTVDAASWQNIIG